MHLGYLTLHYDIDETFDSTYDRQLRKTGDGAVSQ
jgi:hypothetical protein